MVEATELVDESDAARTEERAPVITPKRTRLAQALAFVALVAAFIGALGPADRVRTTYSWPPDELPSGSPSRLWYTPLLLIRRTPEAISARIPCSLPPPLRAAP